MIRLSKGWFRSLEITHNWKTGEYHPHLHMVIAVDKKYFSEYENYLNHEQWKMLWKSCMGIDYEPYVYVKKVRSKKGKYEEDSMKMSDVVSEVAKYSVKADDYIIQWVNVNGKKKHVYNLTDKDKIDGFYVKKGKEWDLVHIGYGKVPTNKDELYQVMGDIVKVLDPALHRRRLAAFGGVFKDVHKLLNLGDFEDGEEEKLNAAEREKFEEEPIKIFQWKGNKQNYLLTKVIQNPEWRPPKPPPDEVARARNRREQPLGDWRKEHAKKWERVANEKRWHDTMRGLNP
jgi:plasmid rolling circle replication initiator protein Rep